MAKKESVAEKAKDKKENPKQADDSGKLSPVDFVKETQGELGKVVWPSRQQLISESAAVILMVVLVATIVYLVDNLFVWISGKVF
ncbi:MAG: preprotein translocase subunit SecE [Cyanobacteria bacterium P01_H01_bin.15]